MNSTGRYLVGVALVLGLGLTNAALLQSETQKRGSIMVTDLTKELKSMISGYFKSPEQEWWIRDLSDSYKWLDGQELLWIIDGATDESILLYRTSRQGWVKLNDLSSGLPIINDILRSKQERTAFPKNSTEQFAKLMMEWIQEPRGYVCSPAFLMEQAAVLSTFLIKGSAGLDVLRKVCVTPLYSETGNRWTVQFNVLDAKGSIKRWTVGGAISEFGVDKVNKEILYQNGTFFYPNEF